MFSFSNNQGSESDLYGKQFNTFHVNNRRTKKSNSKDTRFSDLNEDISEKPKMNKTSNGGLSQQLDQISQQIKQENAKREGMSQNDANDRPFDYEEYSTRKPVFDDENAERSTNLRMNPHNIKESSDAQGEIINSGARIDLKDSDQESRSSQRSLQNSPKQIIKNKNKMPSGMARTNAMTTL
jgi:hypothetical protein